MGKHSSAFVQKATLPMERDNMSRMEKMNTWSGTIIQLVELPQKQRRICGSRSMMPTMRNHSTPEQRQKWDNLVQTHRAKYKRELGSGTNPVKLSEVTERVMAVVGENSPNIVGLGSGLDSTILQMQSSNCSAVETPSQPSHTIELYEEPLQPVQDISTSYIVNCSESCSSNNTNNNGCSHCSTCMEIMALKKRKLQLEVQLLEKRL
ncbi:hypothetical protein MAR_008737 [Mya arenaria]|uniref:Uncharacterized protein n=1 Tax=Mya arenaria TaxID=6604 RepID=A0ABY7E179_MYAAR|nr:hypothetical protein MAR_008737 [Mya arenaria]